MPLHAAISPAKRVRRSPFIPVLCAIGALLIPQRARSQSTVPALLPRPGRVVAADSAPFVLANPVRIVVPAGSRRLAEIADLLADVIRTRTGFVVRIEPTTPGARVRAGAVHLALATRRAMARPSNSEAYTLRVRDRGIEIRGDAPAGVLWGVQTLRQLLPPTFDDANGARATTWSMAAVDISDAPRFAWRGSMVDVGRHFFSVDVIKRHVELLSRYKMNVFHWHLTEDQGWRLAIAKYPALTTIGAWRTEADGTRYGGFYSPAQVREVVEFARRRGVTVVPEIEMPGHSLAALASYPALGCTGERPLVATQWGVFADVYCPGNPETFTFLHAVLDEVMTLFPSRYIHIGGDEVPKDRWRACERCQALMRREHIANEDELQNWFIGRIGAYLESRGRKLIGWNEILHGGHLMASATVQSWEDSSWTRRAVMEGHDVIASPSDWTYLNRPARELTLDHVYDFDPMPPGLTAAQAAHVLGGEVTLWSEHITSSANLELMAYPRLLAFAEVMWSSREPSRRRSDDLTSLHQRIDTDHAPRLRAMGVAVGPMDRDLLPIAVTYDTTARAARIHTTGGVAGVTLRGSSDGRAPTRQSALIADGALLTGQGVRRLQPFYGDAPILAERHVTIETHRAVGARTRAATTRNDSYPGTGAFSLTDGLVGGTDHGDGLWQGWWGPDVDVVVDLDSLQIVRSVRVNFLQNIRSWIALPKQVEFSWSADNITWSAVATRTHDVPVMRDGAVIQPFTAEVPAGTRVRYLRVVGRNVGPLPAGHPGAGKPSWLFADEIIVR